MDPFDTTMKAMDELLGQGRSEFSARPAECFGRDDAGA